MTNVIAFLIGLCIGGIFGMIMTAVLTSGGDDNDGL